MPAQHPNLVRPANPKAAVAQIRLAGKRVVTFLGYSGSGYEDSDAVREAIEGVLASLDPGSMLINAGGTAEGIGIVYPIAKARGFSTAGIVSSRADKEKSQLSADADRIYIIDDDSWGGLMADGELSPTSLAMVGASDEMVAIGGDAIARDELSAAKAAGKPVRYIPADMNHEWARRKARNGGKEEPRDFRGAAYRSFGEVLSSLDS
jgi:hypothetical protein